jgi:hypothetical protein
VSVDKMLLLLKYRKRGRKLARGSARPEAQNESKLSLFLLFEKTASQLSSVHDFK